MVDIGSVGIAVLNGLSNGLLLFMAAAGLTIIFGVLRVINFAHGSFFMIGAYITYFLVRPGGFLPDMPGAFWIAAIIAAVLVALLGGAIERFIIRPIYDEEHIFQLLLTFGVLLLLDNGARILWGTSFRSVDVPPVLSFKVDILGGTVPAYNFFLVAIGFVAAGTVWLLFNRTKMGKIVIASAEDQEIANALGLNVPYIFTGVFIAGSALAGLGGALATPYMSIHPSMGENIIIEAFIIVIIGGVGSFSGALLGALLLGVFEALAFVAYPSIQQFVPFILLVVVLLSRPTGLVGEMTS